MFKKFFQRSPKNEDKQPRDHFKNNVTTIAKPANIPHHSSSHSPFRNETSSQNSYQNSTTPPFKPNNTSSEKFTVKSEKVPKPIYESNQKQMQITPPLGPPDLKDLKESFANNFGSISEQSTEGKHLVQTLPTTKDVWASKIPISEGFHMAFKIVNKDTGSHFILGSLKDFNRRDV